MYDNINKIYELELTGKFAHFRKFYTNSSSLTYLIPPRTTLCGLFASILKRDRNSYYDEFNENDFLIALSIKKGLKLQKKIHTINYLSEIDNKSLINHIKTHKQCRFELLSSLNATELSYRIFVAVKNDKFSELIKAIKKHDLGYGVYLGQRQFLADLILIREYTKQEFKIINTSDYVDSAIIKDNVKNISNLQDLDILIDRMPSVQKKSDDDLRQTIKTCDILIETSGNRIEGNFMTCIKLNNLDNSVISFI